MPRLPEDKIFGLTKRLGEKALNQRAQLFALYVDARWLVIVFLIFYTDRLRINND